MNKDLLVETDMSTDMDMDMDLDIYAESILK